MNNTIPAKKWLLIFLSVLLTLVLLVGLLAFWIDPFYQFRYEDCAYFNNTAKFPGPGLVKHYPYDTLILGSSMTQNFDMDLFRQELGAKPLHLGIGGMGIDELLSYIRLSEQTGTCESYYIGIDQYMLTEPIPFKTPEYLFRDDMGSMLRYLFSYESWFRYIPLDIALSAISRLPVDLPVKLRQVTNIDYLGNWEEDFPFGEDVVIKNYLKSEYGVSSVEPDGLYDRMMQWTDTLFENLTGDKDRYHFFFPPYSVLFWYDAKNDGYFDVYLAAKEYFVDQATKHGVQVYDFQSAPCVFDLDNYKDITHYRGEINDWMTACFDSGDYLSDAESIRSNNEKLTAELEVFADAYRDKLTGAAADG